MERGTFENGLFTCGMSLTMNLVQNYSDHFANSQRSLLSPTGCVKSIPPTTENWLRKLKRYSKKNYKSIEDKHETNTSTTSTMTRTPTRARCTTPEHTLRARSLRHTLILGHMHLMAQGVLESYLIHVHCHT